MQDQCEFNDKRCIIHVDLDCFYVQVERMKDPSLVGVPCAVTQYNKHRGGGIIALSYEAKRAGVKRSMRGEDAAKVCPGIRLVSVPVKYEKADLTDYRDAGSKVFNLCSRFISGSKCLRASIDEAYLDVTNAAERLVESIQNSREARETFYARCKRLKIIEKSDVFVILHFEDSNNTSSLDRDTMFRNLNAVSGLSLLIAGFVLIAELREKVEKTYGFTLSAGVSHNKLLAKLVSGMNKPNKQTMLPSFSVKKLFQSLPLSELNGFKGKLGFRLEQSLGVKYVGDLRKYSLDQLSKVEGDTSQWIYNICRGICEEEVEDRLAPKSISSGKNYRGPETLKTRDRIEEAVDKLSRSLEERVDNHRIEFSQVPQLLTVSWFSQGRSRSKACRMPHQLTHVEITKCALRSLEMNKKEWKEGIESLYLNGSMMIHSRSVETSISTLLQKRSENRQKKRVLPPRPKMVVKALDIEKKKRLKPLDSFFTQEPKRVKNEEIVLIEPDVEPEELISDVEDVVDLT